MNSKDTQYALNDDDDDSDDDFLSVRSPRDDVDDECKPTREAHVVCGPLPPAESIHAVLKSRAVQLAVQGEDQVDNDDGQDEEDDWS